MPSQTFAPDRAQFTIRFVPPALSSIQTCFFFVQFRPSVRRPIFPAISSASADVVAAKAEAARQVVVLSHLDERTFQHRRGRRRGTSCWRRWSDGGWCDGEQLTKAIYAQNFPPSSRPSLPSLRWCHFMLFILLDPPLGRAAEKPGYFGAILIPCPYCLASLQVVKGAISDWFPPPLPNEQNVGPRTRHFSS